MESNFEDRELFSARFEAAHKLYETDPEFALIELKNLAESGSLKSMICLGSIFGDGIAVQKDIEQAEFWYKRAINSGSFRASYYLGALYLRRKEYLKAEMTLSMAANGNYPPALYLLGKHYVFGAGGKKNINMGLDLLERGSKFNHIYARRYLATTLLRGECGTIGRIRGICLLVTGFIEGLRIAFRDPSSPRLSKNGVW